MSSRKRSDYESGKDCPHWDRDLNELPEEAVEDAAMYIATRLKSFADGDYHSPLTWLEVTKKRGLRIHESEDFTDEPGFYLPARFEGGRGMIGINVTLPDEKLCRAWVHELAHHELHIWIPPQLTDWVDMYCYRGDVETVRHRIAERVEVLILD